LASQTVSSANGMAGRSSCTDNDSTTGVSSTAVVSRPSSTVVTVASSATSRNSRPVRPRASRDECSAATSNTFATSASSASTVMATRNSRIGAIRRVTSPAASSGSSPVTRHTSAATEPACHMVA
jgi:hypothetical protein